jgi:hypothetical protein
VPADRPENTTTIVNILACGCIWNGAQMDGAINLEESDVFHFGSPRHPRTLEILTNELTELAASVPFVENQEPQPATILGEEPTPRPVKRTVPQKQDEWDFLKPVSRVRTRSE